MCSTSSKVHPIKVDSSVVMATAAAVLLGLMYITALTAVHNSLALPERKPIDMSEIEAALAEHHARYQNLKLPPVEELPDWKNYAEWQKSQMEGEARENLRPYHGTLPPDVRERIMQQKHRLLHERTAAQDLHRERSAEL